MSNDYFKFKLFTIYHDRCGMKVGTDGVLLGAWCRVDSASHVLDVGTGSGLIAIQIAQRNEKADIVGIEIEEAAALQASENVAHSPWKERIHIICNDFKKYECTALFDLIVSNPPYFVDALRSPDIQRRLARHTEKLTYDLLLRHSRQMLAPTGHIAIIVPAEMEKLVKDAAWENELYVCRQTNVYTKPSKPCRRILFEFSKSDDGCQKDDLYIETSEGGYSEAYKKLTSDFYLRM